MLGMLPAFLFIGTIVLQNRRRDSRRSIPIDGNIPRPAGFSLIQKIQDLTSEGSLKTKSLLIRRRGIKGEGSVPEISRIQPLRTRGAVTACACPAEKGELVQF